MSTSYIGPVPTAPTNVYNSPGIVATSGQTTFPTRGYSPGFEIVWLNGVRLDQSEYTATNGSDIVLDSGASAGDILHIFTINPVDAKLYNALGANIDFNNFALGTGDTKLDETNGLTFDGGTNWLNFFKEDDWTPTIVADVTNPSVTYNAQVGRYTRIGKTISAFFYIGTSAVSGGSGGIAIGGLPETATAATYASGSIGYSSGLAAGKNPDSCLTVPSTTELALYVKSTSGGNGARVQANELTAANSIYGQVTYRMD